MEETVQQSREVRCGKALHLPLSACCISDVGCVRDLNEDNFYLGLEQGLFIVSDGMGGHQAGEIASRIIVEILPKLLASRIKEMRQPLGKSQIQAMIHDAVLELGQLVYSKAIESYGLRGMGATLVFAWFADTRGTVYLANVGDSRAYYYRNNQLNQLSLDHSIVALLLQQGEITPEQVSDHPAHGRLYRYIGMQGEALAEVTRIRLQPGEKLLLCTDGLTDLVEDNRIQTLVSENSELLTTCHALADAAIEQGGRDNITAMLIQWEGEPA